MADQDNLYLENLDECVNDENKIVTYKGLSSMLKVPANRAKEMLSNFVEQQMSKGNALNVTFILGGKPLHPEKGYKFLVVMQEQLEAMKSKFRRVSCCHIYSVQKAKLKSFDILHDTDLDVIKHSLFDLKSWSNIHCEEAKLSDAVLRRRQVTEQNEVLTNGFGETSAVSLDAPAKKENTRPNHPSSGKQISSASFFGATVSKQKKEKPTAQEGSHDEKQASDGGKQNKKDKEKGTSFFRKSTSGTHSQHSGKRQTEGRDLVEEKIKKEENITEEDEMKDRNPEAKASKDIRIKDEMELPEDNPEKEEKAKKSSKKKKRNEEVKINSEEPNVKRRRTNLQEDSSEEEDDFESFIKSSKQENSDVKPNGKKSKDLSSQQSHLGEKGGRKERISDFEEPDDKKHAIKVDKKSKEKNKKTSNEPESKKTKVESEKHKTNESEDVDMSDNDTGKETDKNDQTKKRRKRKRVLKSKTFINDEGYMVTEKVYESESASEESEVEDKVDKKTAMPDIVHMRPKDITRENKKIKAEASKNKTQSSLMSFFKKK